MCEEEGIEPEKPFKGSLNIRLTKELHRHIALLAAQEDISINAYIKHALEEYVNYKDGNDAHIHQDKRANAQ
ncbi:MAG: toxin-antitoxin system HicB family antitoxin [Gammaproteobacteria bacterium]